MTTIIKDLSFLKHRILIRCWLIANKKIIRALLVLNLILIGALSWSINAYAQVNWDHCADENNTCRFKAAKLVRYGAGSNWAQDVFINSVACNSGVFGDSLANTRKICEI